MRATRVTTQRRHDTFRLTPEALASIRNHARNRLNAERIAFYLGCETSTVEGICRRHGIDLVSISDGAPPVGSYRSPCGKIIHEPMQIAIAVEAMDKLRREAARRGIKVDVLVARLAEVVADDNLFAAVFDNK